MLRTLLRKGIDIFEYIVVRFFPGAEVFSFVSAHNFTHSAEPTMTAQLADKHCVPCRGGVPPLQGEELKKLHREIPQWTVTGEHRLHREFRFPDFKQALNFVNRVGAIAEEEGHHPDILLTWGKAEITLWTHSIGGVSESDFILAAKIDKLNA